MSQLLLVNFRQSKPIVDRGKKRCDRGCRRGNLSYIIVKFQNHTQAVIVGSVYVAKSSVDVLASWVDLKNGCIKASAGVILVSGFQSNSLLIKSSKRK